MSDPMKGFVAGIVEEARGPRVGDRRLAGGETAAVTSAMMLTENADNDTRRVFVVGFDTVGDPTAVVR